MEKTIHISEQDLHSTLDEFLQESENKPEPRIWNRLTIAGIGLLLASAAYTGYSVLAAFNILSPGSFPLLYTVMKLAPFIGGAFLGLVILTAFKKGKNITAKSQHVKSEKMKTRDKLDDFLYNKEEKSEMSSMSQTAGIDSVQKLYKSRTDRKIFGICGGLAKYLGMNSTVLRIIFIAALFLSANTFLLVYIALAFVMPKEPAEKVFDYF
ncbi:MAG: PspC domain-containing protein [Balneolaceae bacterium]|nr:MAG: PspC domain-containing protein [Balneolaceae bacterium]